VTLTSDTLGKEDLRKSLAASIERVRRASSENCDEYWHVRETAIEIARLRGIKIPEVIGRLKDFLWLKDSDVARISDPVWLEVMPPEWLVRDVLES
jgi:hypothetical protein